MMLEVSHNLAVGARPEMLMCLMSFTEDYGLSYIPYDEHADTAVSSLCLRQYSQPTDGRQVL